MEGKATQAKQSPVEQASSERPGVESDREESAIEYHQRIARRAYEFYEERGNDEGHAIEDWFRAEAEEQHDQH